MPGIIRDFYDVCPACWSVRIKHRVFKNPRYKCEKCGSEFPNKKRISYVHRKMFNDVLKIVRRELVDRGVDMVDDKTIREVTVKTVKEHLAHA